MTNQEANKLGPGLYILSWTTGGRSLAAVGILHDGTRWMAATNWTALSEHEAVQSADWSVVEAAQLIATRDEHYQIEVMADDEVDYAGPFRWRDSKQIKDIT